MKNTADIVIIGGGCMGASVAYHLARRGITDIVLIEREPLLGMGSTGRNAGGVRHQFSNEANIKLSIESIQLFEHFSDEVGYEIDFHQHGYLFLLSTEASVTAFRQSMEIQRRFGVTVDMLSPEEARTLAPGLNVDGVLSATFCARDGIADPNGVTQGFAKAAQALGVEVWKGTEVVGIELSGPRVSAVHTRQGSIATHTAVNAAGPWARQIGRMAGIEIPVLPYRRHIFITEPLKALGEPRTEQTARWPENRIMVIDFETTFYFHREGAGLLFGMSDPEEPSSYDITVNWGFLEKVIPIATRRLPALADMAIAHAWAGLYESTPDAMPIIGAAGGVEGFYLINGFSGHGFQHSPAAGRLLADLICTGVREELSPFALERFQPGKIGGEKNVV